jgi:hypothetical protein
MVGKAMIVRHSFSNPYWWGWHRFVYAMHTFYGRQH